MSNKLMGFRPSQELRRDFKKKVAAMHKKDGYTTQNKVLIELMYLWVQGKTKIPGE